MPSGRRMESCFCNKTGDYSVIKLFWVVGWQDGGSFIAFDYVVTSHYFTKFSIMKCAWFFTTKEKFAFCRFRMHYIGPHMSPIHRLMLFSESCLHGRCHRHIFEQTNLLQLTKRLLMLMGEFFSRYMISSQEML